LGHIPPNDGKRHSNPQKVPPCTKARSKEAIKRVRRSRGLTSGENREKIRKVKMVTKVLYVTYLRRTPCLTDLPLNLRVGSRPGRHHVSQILE